MWSEIYCGLLRRFSDEQSSFSKYLSSYLSWIRFHSETLLFLLNLILLGCSVRVIMVSGVPWLLPSRPSHFDIGK